MKGKNKNRKVSTLRIFSNFRHRNQTMEFVMTNEILKLEEEILRNEEFISAYDEEERYFADLNEEEAIKQTFFKSQH